MKRAPTCKKSGFDSKPANMSLCAFPAHPRVAHQETGLTWKLTQTIIRNLKQAIKSVCVSISHDRLSGHPGSLMFKMSGEQGAKVTLMDELRLDDFALEICYSLIPPPPHLLSQLP